MDSQQTLVAAPVINSVSMPRLLSWASMSEEPAMQAEDHPDLFHPQVGGGGLERRVELEALGGFVEAREALRDPLGREHVFVVIAPVVERARRRRLDPHDFAAGIAHRFGEAIDRRHDLARQRHFRRKTFGNEMVLHVDHDQRRARRIDGVVTEELALALEQPLFDGIGHGVAMHERASARVNRSGQATDAVSPRQSERSRATRESLIARWPKRFAPNYDVGGGPSGPLSAGPHSRRDLAPEDSRPDPPQDRAPKPGPGPPGPPRGPGPAPPPRALAMPKLGLAALQAAMICGLIGGNGAELVRFVPGARLIGIISDKGGWWTQQLLKIRVSEIIRSERYVLLDSKNHLISPLRRDFLETMSGQARINGHSFIDDPMRNYLECTLRYLGIDPGPHLEWFTRTTTPFTMLTRQARELAGYLDGREGNRIVDVFQEKKLTEFFLYSGFLVSKGLLTNEYELNQPHCQQIWGETADQTGCAAAVEKAERSDCPFLAVHSKAIARMDRKSRATIAKFWHSRGLFRSVRDGMRFLASPNRTYQSCDGWVLPWPFAFLLAGRSTASATRQREI